MREWLTRPLKDVEQIHLRQGAIATFCDTPHVLAEFREQLHGVRDMERTLARLSVGTGNARDLVVLKESLVAAPKLKKILEGEPPGEMESVAARQEPRPPDLLRSLVSQITAGFPVSSISLPARLPTRHRWR